MRIVYSYTHYVSYRMDSDTDKATLFTFYTMNTGVEFDLHDRPSGWNWVGAGSTYPMCNTQTWGGWLRQQYRKLCGPPTKYKREEQYAGPKETKEEMREYLDKKLDALTKAGVLKFYKIQDTFRPVPV